MVIESEVWITAISGLSGAIIGGLASYWGSHVEIKHQNKLREKEDLEIKKRTSEMIKSFLIEELKMNNDKIKNLKPYLELDYDTFIADYQQTDIILPNDLRVNEFNNLKYELIKINIIPVKNIFNFYRMFELINNTNKLNVASKHEFNYIKINQERLESYINTYEKRFMDLYGSI
ncbi:hypothetical protein [Pontibacillus marinus]|uniref:Uncharacterized protein n=1 Tax=Pontibacillus marinus BH030004 = DSM 16465 TaxID=1385511 RepID=A0A0A5G6F6_9BACI|nr:hypothetical protein [Pontibacillus marinus]KGX86675.1 hypothetical protein N783_11810 [Pontibacillus marinus BH030004 = DSM 16465]